ncbi:YveK family protein [Priestia megaterium]|uniref:YveK family protein n=1 Tax=Priestia megaterium TaxID=1404 RepID=UPI0027315DB6|nr:Wzz/FepE/Etk N-terminal domain-containing protein [Priestia megaterium]MDP1443094.1 Wzz/FepE/Etk N-terminal domain-containing protein [Priestia megaterium]MDP1472240.1 Wzz/FepE/Etk N-terminal domain-containing protein [Priestia megaterium]
MEKTINLKELFQLLKKRLLLIVIVTAIFIAISGIVSYFFLTPIYQSSTQILVNQVKSKNEIYNPSEVQTNLQLINTYNVIIKSPAILDKVIEKENLEMTSEQLEKLVSVSNEQESQVVNITVQHEDSQKSKNIANTIATTFQKEIKPIMNVDNVSILTKAGAGSLIKPNLLLNMALALAVGLIAGVGLAFLLEYLDTTIKNDKDVEEHLGLPVLGSINIINKDSNPKRRNSKMNISEIRGDSIGS